MNRRAAEQWVASHVEPIGALETAKERAWATVLRVPVDGGSVWFKACAAVQAFEPRLTAALFARWPDRVAEVIALDEERSWLLLADAGTVIGGGDPLGTWLEILPLYAELQRGEAPHAATHLAHGVPDLRLSTLPARYEELLEGDLPLDAGDVAALAEFAPRFAEMCDELAAGGVAETVQHDDLHAANVFTDGERLRVLDWGDASISHPFSSLFVTFRFLGEAAASSRGEPLLTRLRDAYLEPWGAGLTDLFELSLRLASFAHLFTWARHRQGLRAEPREEFDHHFAAVLRRAVAETLHGA